MEDLNMLPRTRTHRNLPGSFIDKFFDDNFLSVFSNWEKSYENDYTPAVNVEESDKAFEIELATPGVDKKDIKINVDSNVLHIASGKEIKDEQNSKAYIRREFNYNSFSRSFTLPENTDSTKIKASHKSGILRISIPKVEVKIKEIQIH